MSEIPGADVLGFGFNVLGDYDVSSVTQQIFAHQNMDVTSWTFQPTSITYAVPDNTSVVPYTQSTGSGQVFNTQEQFQSYFAAKAGISGSYGAFSGEFNMAYSQTMNTDQSYYYGLYEADYTGWKLVLSDQSSGWLSQSFTSDPDVEQLPTTFSPQNQDLFFAVFRKFGTHFISQVTVGGSLDYFVAVEKSYSYNEQQIQANISLEYKAVFTSASAQSEAEWQQLGQNWASSRSVKVDAVGGSASILNALDPGYGDSDQGPFNSWSSDVMKNPAVIAFELRPLSLLFDGDRAKAVQQALQVYTNGAIVASGNSDCTPGRGPGGGNFTTSSSIMVSGTSILPNPPVTPPQPTKRSWGPVVPIGGYQIALLDPTSLSPIMSHIYYQDPSNPLSSETAIYNAIMADIGTVTQSGYIAVVVAFAIDLMNYPSPQFAQWLSSIGAAMDGWKQFLSFCGSPGQASYVCIGKQGLLPGNAVESFAAATDWVDSPFQSTTDASAVALLYAQSPLTRTGVRAFRSLAAPVKEPAGAGSSRG